MLIRGGRVVTARGEEDADVLVRDGKIADVRAGIPAQDPVIDAKDLLVLPAASRPISISRHNCPGRPFPRRSKHGARWWTGAPTSTTASTSTSPICRMAGRMTWMSWLTPE